MKFAAVAVLSLAALVSAQSRDEIPKCAQSCLDDSVKKTTTCDVSDFKCICEESNMNKVQTDATPCVLKACGITVATGEVIPATQKLCSEAAKGGSSAPASSAPASSAAGSAPATGAATSAAATTAAAPTGAASKPATTECSTLVPSASKSSNGTAPTASAPVTAGAAGFAPVGGLALLAIGALAL